MKGQIFILLLILILIALLSLRTRRVVLIEEKNPIYETFLNLKNELIETIDLSLLNGEDITTNLNNFINFSQNILKHKGYNSEVNYTITSNGKVITVFLNLSLSYKNSYLKDNLVINRTVYS